MKLKLVALLVYSFLNPTVLYAGIMREDVAVQDYRDFAENLGKYGVGKENIHVYRKDGSLAGVLTYPMPDFGAVVSGGYATLFSPSYLVSVQHNTGYRSVDFGNNAKYKTTYTLIARNEDSTRDFHLPRLNKVVTEAAPIPSVKGTELRDNPERYTWYARVGAGVQSQVDAATQQTVQLAGAYSWKSGGTITSPTFENWRLRWYNYSPDDDRVQPLDSAGASGDSGSPLLVYDNEEKVWKLAGVATSIAGSAPYSMRTYVLFIQDDFVAQAMAENTDADITDISSGGLISWNKDAIIQGEKSWAWHGVEALIPAQATNEELNSSKDLRFNGDGGAIVLNQSVNHGAAKLQFSGNYQIKSSEGESYTWVGGGVEVDSGKTVLWQINGLADDVLHKIGAGTLHVNAAGVNDGGLNVGDGTVILDQQSDETGLKQAFSTVTLVSGRPVVVLADAGQVASKNIRFGYRGGTLDINGTTISFSEILHNDSGATLVNRNRDKTAVLTLSGNDFQFLGHIGEQNSGALALVYEASDSAWHGMLSGGIDVQTLKVARGELVLSGAQTPHAGNVVYSDDWIDQTYQAEKIDVYTNTTLTVSDHARVNSALQVAEKAILNLYAHASLAGSITLSGTDSLLRADITERDSNVAGLSSLITANISGQGQLSKTGAGTLQIDGDITTRGDTHLLAGTLALNGNVTSIVNMASDTILAGNGRLQELNAEDAATIYPGALLTGSTDYATLRLSSLNASGTVTLRLNSAFRSGTTDRLLIQGDVNEEKPVQVIINSQSLWADSDNNQNGSAENTEGVSVIQVGGRASKESFRLAESYVAQGAWAFGLYAFAPGKAAESERALDGTGNQYWDYRLQNIMLSEEGISEPVTPESPDEEVPEATPESPADETPEATPEPPVDETPEATPEPPADETPEVTPESPADEKPEATPESPADETPEATPEPPADETPETAPVAPASNRPTRRAVTPQVPAYINLPSALFRAEEQRTLLFKTQARQHPGFFLFGYRGDERYRSANDFLNYGYSYKSRYKGWTMGSTIRIWQHGPQSLSVSGAWSKGDLLFKPSAVDGYSRGDFNGNTLNLLIDWRYGDYDFSLLSGYGRTKGAITTHLRGKAASPKAEQTFIEIEAGKTLAYGAHRLRPYIGYRHQQMRIKAFTDIDRADVSYPQQRREAWIGGLGYQYRLPVGSGTLFLSSDLQLAMRPAGQGKVVVGKDAKFQTGNSDESLRLQTEARLALSQDLTLSTRVHHQRRLQQEGANDWLFSGGVTVSF